ncbi:hypothetical protein [Flavobacterium sp.]|uniref:hypothetical protein n=1 Tax=Flavobacterium sp. TaxID=239 RepID=UPI0008D4CA7F|nr:hypothetical protein [Flavobacterium sp.]OGS62274.1 MAG: hypothetical protein A2X07_00055 [Flavobacteria bacterium GWF1_32_7]HBD26837.1 hypothetical protein [Flavobacterium sp.]
MKLQIEIWSEERKFSKNANVLLNESVISFKNSAYRSSLLFSYLFFLTLLKEIIIKSTKPVAIPQGRWDNIIAKLQSDETWEKAVYEEIINNSSPIFNINDDIRQQFKYWKDRRNDCAHFKDNNIEPHHTESYWSFITSNFSKITIEGGQESLINKLIRHYDPTFTPPDANVEYLVKEIEFSIDKANLQFFWKEMIERLDEWGLLFYSESNISKLLKKIFEVCSEETKESLAHYLKTEEYGYDTRFIYIYPELIHYFEYSPSEVREIWRKKVLRNESSAYSIYATLLRNQLIPTSEINESINYIFEKISNYKPNDEQTHLALAGNGFGELIFEVAFKQKRLGDWFNWVNPRADLIAYYIEKYPLKDETVEIICEMYTRDKYSFWLSERLVRIFKENNTKKSEFHSIATKNGNVIPTELQ